MAESSSLPESTGSTVAIGVMMHSANIPPPRPLVMNDNLATNWKQWRKTWQRYEIATGLCKQAGLIRVATFLTIIGEEANKVYDIFTWANSQDEQCLADVLSQFDIYCEPRTQVIYERFRFNNRNQRAGESIPAYITELRTIAMNCAHEGITPDEILRDRLVLGLKDDGMRERLLRVNDLTLGKALDICKAAEQTSVQIHEMQVSSRDSSLESVCVVKQQQQSRSTTWTDRSNNESCKYCVRRHAKRECPAYGLTCRKCGKKPHFQAKCRATQFASHTVDEEEEEEEEVFFIGLIGEQPSKAVVTLQIGRPNKHSRVEFQMDRGAECNVIPKKQHIQATGDHQMKRVDSRTKKFIKTYTGERYPILGSVTLPIWRNGKEDELSFSVTQHDFIPLFVFENMCQARVAHD